MARSPPSSIDDVSSNEIEPTEQSELAAFVRQFIEADDTIAELNKSTESTRQRIRELKKKKTQLSRVIAAIMDKADIDMLEPEGRDGSSIGRLTCVRSARKKPTVSALEKTILEEVCGVSDQAQGVSAARAREMRTARRHHPTHEAQII